MNLFKLVTTRQTLTFQSIVNIGLFIICLFVFVPAKASDEHQHNDEQHQNESDHHNEQTHHDQVVIDDKIAEEAGIRTETARSGEINQMVKVYGNTVFDPSEVSHVRARFTGIISQVSADIGDHVIAGQVLATIESNESLKTYKLKSPISGTITARHANAGELTQQQVLFTITNDEFSWAEFKIFPMQQANIKAGQTIWVHLNDYKIASTIAHLIPNDKGLPYIIARARLDNSNKRWHSGLLVEGQIITQQIHTQVSVNNNALQSYEGNTVVFVKQGQTYQARAIKIGKQDHQNTEVLSGLSVGEVYVSQNSYLIKADLGKSSAGHSH